MDRIGRYLIAGEVGRGSMGVVYRAVDPAIGRDVAIKTIRLDANDGHSVLRERLFQEARSAGVLSHPNIVTIYDMGEADVDGVGTVAYVAMGLVKGPSLEDLMLAPEPLAGPRMMSILRQTAIALDYAHSRGLVHRDIKPGNIMTDEDGSVKITDFGIARFLASQHLNETETITGTPNYMSPEQVQGLEIDGRTDQFSLSVIAWEILTGERPFSGDNLSTVVYRIVSEEPPPAHQLNGSLSPRIDEVLRRALAKNPTARFANCAGFIGALETACAETPAWKPAPNGSFYSMPTVGVNWEKPIFEVPVVTRPAPQPHRSSAPAVPVIRPRASRDELDDEGPRYGVWFAAAAFVLAGFGAIAFWPGREEPALTRATTTVPSAGDVSPLAPKVADATTPPAAEASVPPVTPREELSAPEPAATRSREALQDIWLETTPGDARAVMDGNRALACKTPCILHARPGTHTIVFSLEGFRNESREVSVHDQTVDLPAVKLQEIMGSLLVATSPPGASIMLNGEQLSQTTPAALTLKPGAYRVTVARNGVSRTENVRVGDRPHLLKIPLE